MRPLGIAALEDKIVQQAARMVLECIYEQDFLGFSYGFRPRRSSHQALDALYVGISKRKVNWIIDADIRGFFDNISHEWMMKFLEHRIADRRMLRLLKKWLRAGVSEDGEWSPTKVGTPQGAVISPLFANVFLHYVLDLWINEWRKRQAKGEVIIVRYADDFVIGFREESDARRCLAALGGTDGQVWLGTAPREDAADRIRAIRTGAASETRRWPTGDLRLSGFHAYQREDPGRRIHNPPQNVAEEIPSQTSRDERELMRRRHDDPAEVGDWLHSVYRGWCQYYAVPGNCARLQQFRYALQAIWLRTLQRRSQRGRRLTWEVLQPLRKLATDAEDPASLSQREVSTSSSKVRAVCGNSARTDLCGGRSQ